MEGPALEPTSPARTETTVARAPALELWIAFVASLVPDVLALFVGGYGQLVTNAPLAVVVTIVDVVAMVIAYFQFREDAQARRAPHWVSWATIAVGALWLMYAVFVGGVILLSKTFCISDVCRAPLR